VLGSANVDEALRGYYTKYDCSAADINPIGGVNKRDLKAFLHWTAAREDADLRIGVLARVADAQPSAELTGAEGEQSDAADMGMTYDELGDLGYCRKVEKCGPLSTFLKLRDRWNDGRELSPSIRATGLGLKPSTDCIAASGFAAPETFDEQVAQKVKDFYFFNCINRHKMTTLTPSYHAENYSPDDNRFDLRPFLTSPRFEMQFKAIDEAVAAAAKAGHGHGKRPAAAGEGDAGASRAKRTAK
jgi:NAD+ synthase (glutamine-hydrolysing)